MHKAHVGQKTVLESKYALIRKTVATD